MLLLLRCRSITLVRGGVLAWRMYVSLLSREYFA